MASTAPAASTPSAAVSLRVRLGGTRWSVWRDVALRSAGFPADMVLAICDEPLARSADLAAADPAAAGPGYDAVYAAAAGRLSGAIAGTIADPGFLEALTWQNPRMVQLLGEWGQGLARRSKDRKRELVIASYLQRYCLKNDTIGVFGPVGWASVAPGTAGLVVTPGEQLIARRTTYFEVWAIDKVAAAIAGQGRVLGWLRPRRTRSAFLAGNVLHRPYRKPVTLTGDELRVLLACDGCRTISQVLASAGMPGAHALLARLAELGALRLDLEGPVHAWPERLLRDQLEQIADPAAQAAALAPVERVVKARDAVAASAGDAIRLGSALADLAVAFEEVTGSPATRRAGQLYAGRTLVYQDAVRDVRVELGEAVTGALAGPLGLVLDSARWLVNEITDRYRVLFAELLDREMARAGGAPVPLTRLLTVASADLATGIGRAVSEITAAGVAELQRRWQQVLGPPSSDRRHQVSADAISARAAECFPGRPVAWSGARQYSPDIMIAAASPGEVQRGNFLLVLGELHLATNTLENRSFIEQHPDPARLIAAQQADYGPRRIIGIPAKDHPAVTSRSSPPPAILVPGQVYWSSAVIDSFDPPEPAAVMPGAAMTVTRRGEDLVVQLLPSGAELDFFEVIGDMISAVVVDAFQPAAPAAHQPRITIDRLVLSREQWRFQVADSGWAFAKDEQERYCLARRWRREHHLPERVFYRVPGEAKPMAADFRSLVLVNLFAKHIRQTKAAGHAGYSVSEMLPDLGQLWLADRQGRRYSSELRIVAVDGLPEDVAS
jgi:Lantibiotic dehydratase, N terminus